MQSVFEASWAGAAAKVAYDVEFLTKDYSKILGSSNEELSKFAKEGNEAIFVDVFPKLRDLYLGPALKGLDALGWDKITLAEEQYLVQPIYIYLLPPNKDALRDNIYGRSNIAKVFNFFDNIFGIKEGKTFPSVDDIFNVHHRWMYGMDNMGHNMYLAMPEVSDYYKNGGSTPKSSGGGRKHDTPLAPAKK